MFSVYSMYNTHNGDIDLTRFLQFKNNNCTDIESFIFNFFYSY